MFGKIEQETFEACFPIRCELDHDAVDEPVGDSTDPDEILFPDG